MDIHNTYIASYSLEINCLLNPEPCYLFLSVVHILAPEYTVEIDKDTKCKIFLMNDMAKFQQSFDESFLENLPMGIIVMLKVF